ncbi:MAG: hypothetical protein ACLQMH_15275 [Solirubrobacteraceae bacterium]
MTIHPRRTVEFILALKGSAATKDEASSAGVLCHALAEDPEAPSDVKSQATIFARELAGPNVAQEPALREALIQAVTALAGRAT